MALGLERLMNLVSQDYLLLLGPAQDATGVMTGLDWAGS
jgi:hypothetical protein